MTLNLKNNSNVKYDGIIDVAKENYATLQNIINIIIKKEPLEILLDFVMDEILSVTWLETLPKGGIFLADDFNKTLNLVSKKNLAPQIRKLCSVIPYGHCLCGRAANSKNIQFAHCVDERHDVKFEGMGPHGHYNIPILMGAKLLGVLVIYLPHGHEKNQEEIVFLESVANNIGTLIHLKKQEDELTSSKARLQSKLADLEISHDKLTASRLIAEELRYALDAHSLVSITDVKGNITFVNSKFCAVSGYSEAELIGHNHRILKSDVQDELFFKDLWEKIASGHKWQGEICNINKEGAPYWVYSTIVPLLNKDTKKPEQYISIRTEITENKNHQRKMELLAHYDPLTKLANRTLFADHFAREIARNKRNDTLVIIAFLDLDNFKQINDTYGHEVGDQILIQVADRIRRNMRQEDMGCRQGGDEFVLLMGGISSAENCEITLQRLLDKLSHPYIIDGKEFNISISSGAAVYPDDNVDLDTLMRHADQAMYQVKVSGKNNYLIFNAEENKKLINKNDTLIEIKQALLNEEFCLYYQPKINMTTGHIFGFEALIRWEHPEIGLIQPLDFLPVIEGTDLEVKIGQWVIGTALEQLEEWHGQGLIYSVSINIAASHMHAPTFIDDLKSALDNHPDILPKYLELEILENSNMGELDSIRPIVQTCIDTLGVQMALDDFGTGYSSLTHLRMLPTNTIKIDRSFVKDLLWDPEDFAIADGVIKLSNSFSRRVIAEGVETTQHGLVLILMGCEEAQGYGIARPMAANDIPEWLETYRPNLEWIACAKTIKSTRDRHLEILKITTEHWFNKFTRTFQASLNNEKTSLLFNHEKHHSIQWLNRMKQEQIFNSVWLDKLELAFEKFYKDLINITHVSLDKEKDLKKMQENKTLKIYETLQRVIVE